MREHLDRTSSSGKNSIYQLNVFLHTTDLLILKKALQRASKNDIFEASLFRLPICENSVTLKPFDL
jgi:hypothetical protein